MSRRTTAGRVRSRPADSNIVQVTVKKATSTTGLVAIGKSGRSPVLISVVKLNNGQTPVGAVQFREGDTVLATVPVSPAGDTGYAAAFYRLPNVAKGSHVYRAFFVPTDGANVQQSASNPVRINR